MSILILVVIIFVLFYLFYLFYLFNLRENYETNNKYFFSIMAIFKNEEDYLQEWLEHHIGQGVEHFYLYCNDPDNNKYTYLLNKNYDKYITLIDWTNQENNQEGTVQKKAYFDCVKKYSHETKYLMMLDIDEFLFPTTNKTAVSVIKEYTNNNKVITAIKVQRFDYGSNGHKKKPNGRVVDNYFNHEKICSSFKTIANTSYIDKTQPFYGVHDFIFRENIESKESIINAYLKYKDTAPCGCTENDVNEIPLKINHYYSKSYEEFMKRCKMWEKGGVNNIRYRKNCDELFKQREKIINLET